MLINGEGIAKCKSPYWNKPRTKGVVASAEHAPKSLDIK